VHGSAPDIAGRSVAGRLALLLAAGLALEHVGKAEAAQRLRTATDQTLRADGVRTADLGGKPSTQEFANAIVRRID
jgi:isocitrate dehydrogenase (NAD+)